MKKKMRKSRRGFVLLMVLMAMVLASILGMTYLSAASLKAVSSQNLADCSRAKYLAESGISHGIYLLEYFPETVIGSSATSQLGPYYADGTGDSYTFYVTTIDSDGHYAITGTGTCGGISQKATSKLTRSCGKPFTGGNAITSGLSSTSSLYIPPSVKITGNMLAKGSIDNDGTIDGDVAYTKNLANGGVITGSSTKLKNASTPKLTFNDYNNYKLFGKTYSSTLNTDAAFTFDDPLANGGAITTANPGGVVKLNPIKNGTATLAGNLNFKGTFIVSGDLIIDGSNIKIEAVQGFPALVVSGAIYIRNSTGVDITGIVYSRDGMQRYSEATPKAKTTITGAFLSSQYGYGANLAGTHNVIYSTGRCSLYDVTTGKNPAATITLNGWSE